MYKLADCTVKICSHDSCALNLTEHHYDQSLSQGTIEVLRLTTAKFQESCIYLSLCELACHYVVLNVTVGCTVITLFHLCADRSHSTLSRPS